MFIVTQAIKKINKKRHRTWFGRFDLHPWAGVKDFAIT